jgi:hypothetical protein
MAAWLHAALSTLGCMGIVGACALLLGASVVGVADTLPMWLVVGVPAVTLSTIVLVAVLRHGAGLQPMRVTMACAGGALSLALFLCPEQATSRSAGEGAVVGVIAATCAVAAVRHQRRKRVRADQPG